MPGYRTKQESIAIAGAEHLVIRSLFDRQQYADPLGRADAAGISSAAWPMFGWLWPSSLQLAARLAARPLVPRERILELGCGLALASLVAHRRGADVTASDRHPLAAEFLAENTRLNRLAPLPYRHGDWADGPVDASTPARLDGRFDLVIGSDVLHERDEAGHLCRFIDRHALPSAEVLIVDPDRGNRAAFHRLMAAAGFALHETRLHVDAYRGRLLHYRRESPAG